MARLRNTLSWSPSRAHLFDECRRAYWYNYYGAWGGWEPSAPEEARLAYRLKNMTNLDQHAGTVVHAVIERWLARRPAVVGPGEGSAADGEPVDGDDGREAMREQARALLNDGWRESRSRAWTRDPKRKVNLFEHYYEADAGGPVPRERIDRIRDKVFTCVDGFFGTGLAAKLARVPRSAWLALEALDSFAFDGVKVFAKPDFAHGPVADGEDGAADGPVFIYDWKSGGEDDSHLLQLATYAIYARAKWGVPTERVRAVPVYLLTGKAEPHTLDAQAIERAKAAIRASLAEMRALLRDPERNVGVKEDFPATAEAPRCARCFFRGVCGEKKA